MAQVIRVRDIARSGTYELGPKEPILRVPYDLFQPKGAVHRTGQLVEWSDAETTRQARVAPAELGDTQPGQRVLVQLPPATEHDAAVDDEWWLCDVEAVDGSAGTQ
jgi:hypothetical protein